MKKKGIGGRGKGECQLGETASLESWRLLPRIFVIVASKGLSPTVSLLFAILAGKAINVAAKGLTRTMCWEESNWVGWEDFEGVRRTAWRRRMVRRARKNRADLQNNYNILVPCVNDYL